jgi:putative component of membrane protein insertase Oxa1/YidC/SpoIIIJ protein YidD
VPANPALGPTDPGVRRPGHRRLAPTAPIAVALALAAGGCGVHSRPLLTCSAAQAFAPWDAAGPAPGVAGGGPRADRSGGLFTGLIGVYQRRMRAPREPGQGCRLRPTCSAYGRQSLERWGALGVLLIADRLVVREHAFMDGSYLPACALDASRDHGLHDPVP